MTFRLLGASAALAAIACPAAAQTSAEPEPTASEPTSAREIIVTATRRNQVLSDVPIAVTAVTGAQLQNSGASDVRQLQQVTPSLFVSSASNESSAVARIRGIGTLGENPGLESSVALFIDGVYRSRTGVGLGELGAIERVEVLRGPQGTLFGRNASAGLINIVTRKPEFDFGGEAEASYGNYNYYRLQGGVTGPIVGDTVAARLDGVLVKRDGFQRDVISGRRVNDRDRYLLRGQVKIVPSSSLSILLAGDYGKKSEECCSASFISPIRAFTRVNPDGGDPVETANTVLALLQTLGAQIQTAPTGVPYVRSTSITPGASFAQNSKDYGVSGEVNWKLGGATLTSITAYRYFSSFNAQDSDFEALDLYQQRGMTRQFKTFSQEARLQGAAFNGRLDWLVGGYYADEKLFLQTYSTYGKDLEKYYNCLSAGTFLDVTDPSCFNRARVAASTTATATQRALAGLQPFAGFTGFDARGGFRNVAAAIGYVPPAGQDILAGTGGNGSYFNQSSRNFAGFTHNVINIVRDRLTLTLGARYTSERKKLTTVFTPTNLLCTALRESTLAALVPSQTGGACLINSRSGPGITTADPGATKRESEWSGTAVLSFKPIDHLLLYGSYSRGYKAGGYNLDTSALDQPSAAVAAVTPVNAVSNGRPDAADLRFEPEIVDAYEIGAKLDLREFKLNVALFRQNFDNFQLNTFNGVTFEVVNLSSCKDDLGGRDRDGIANNSACASDRLKPGLISKGAEVEAFLYPSRDVTVTAGFTLADTRYANNLTGSFGRSLPATLFQLPGQAISNAARYTTTASAAWQPSLGGGLSGLVYVDMRYQSKFNSGSDLDLEKDQPGFALVNARIGVYGRDRRWGIELWGQNILNELYKQVDADAPFQGSGAYRAVTAPAASGLGGTENQLYITFPAEPRTYGVTLRTRF